MFPAYSGKESNKSDKIEGTLWLNNESFTVLSDLNESSGNSQNASKSAPSKSPTEALSQSTDQNETTKLTDPGPSTDDKLPVCSKSSAPSIVKTSPEELWLNSQSFTVLSKITDSCSSSDDSDSSSSSDHEQTLTESTALKKKRRKWEEIPEEILPPLILDFDGSEKFYVDKKSERGYLRTSTLHQPARPRYFFSFRSLGRIPRKPRKEKVKRYFSRKFQKRLADSRPRDSSGVEVLPEEDFLEGNKQLNKATMDNVKNVQSWIDLVKFQDRTPMKNVSKVQLAERKFDILDRALQHNPSSDDLYSLYLSIANNVLPSFEVSKIVEKLLPKAPTNFVLWRGLIQATQGSMARCVVPDVLKLYERAMQQMYRKKRCDETMLKLFQSCAFFLRQSGLQEQLFALIKLALELNVNPEKFSGLKPSEKDQDLLIEFEEVVLSSGLPMNEIWLRVEKLRTNFYFLPCPSGFTCSDPQRMVFNEDVCHFIYPLNERGNSLKLVFIILRLLRVPLPIYKFHPREESEWDAIEDILSVFYHRSFASDSAFDGVLWDLIKELNMGPSYFPSQIGHEIYTKTVQEVLSLLSSCFTGVEQMVLNLIWMRFERILVMIAKKEGKLTEDAKKRTRSKFKKFLKLEENRNEINYFVEFASLEYDMENKDVAIGVLESSFNQGIQTGMSNKEKFHICATLVEMHLAEMRLEEALNVLICLGRNSSLSLAEEEVLSEAKKLVALSGLKKNLETLSTIESNVEVMEEEQMYLPDYLINSIMCLVWAKALIKGKSSAVKTICDLKGKFCGQENKRHIFIRENLWELEVAVKGLVIPKDPLIPSWKDFEMALEEFPNNLFLIKKAVNFKGTLWFKLKSLALKSHSSAMIIFLIASVRLWYLEAVQSEGESHLTMAHKYRVRSLLHEVVMKDEKLKKNAILWRLYLRILFELENSFDQCKNALFSALDECAWNKSLYQDGAVYVPHELTQIQDLIIEKQLRIYALPEELEILRTDSV